MKSARERFRAAALNSGDFRGPTPSMTCTLPIPLPQAPGEFLQGLDTFWWSDTVGIKWAGPGMPLMSAPAEDSLTTQSYSAQNVNTAPGEKHLFSGNW